MSKLIPIISIASLFLISAGCATPPATSDGLVAARSSMLDELYLRPNADLSAYRRVVIDAVPVQFRSDYLSQRHGWKTRSWKDFSWPASAIPLGGPVTVGASDRHLSVGDCLNHRVVRVNLLYAAQAVAAIPGEGEEAEDSSDRRRLV